MRGTVVYGFFSDVHGDLQGMQRSISSLNKVDELFFLGDVAGGRNVRECLKILRETGIACVPGNHDLWDFELSGLAETDRKFLTSLKLEIERPSFTCVHSDYIQEKGNLRFPYIQSCADAKNAFGRFKKPLVFYGHTHVSQVFRQTAEGSIEQTVLNRDSNIKLDENSRYLVNVGMAANCVVTFTEDTRVVNFRFFSDQEPRVSQTKGSWRKTVARCLRFMLKKHESERTW